MNFRRHFLQFTAVCVLVLMPPVCVGAQNPPVVISGRTIPDVELVDQHGKKVHFYSDLIKGRVVAINTIFTTCTTICPENGAKFSKLSRLLADEGRGRVGLISISVDPEVDTPQLLDRWSHEFGTPGPDWTLVTGPKSEVDRLLKALQIFNPDKQQHSPDFLIGGDDARDWAHPSSSYTPSQLAALIRTRLKQVSAPSTSRP
jgi:protein SCO1